MGNRDIKNARPVQARPGEESDKNQKRWEHVSNCYTNVLEAINAVNHSREKYDYVGNFHDRIKKAVFSIIQSCRKVHVQNGPSCTSLFSLFDAKPPGAAGVDTSVN